MLSKNCIVRLLKKIVRKVIWQLDSVGRNVSWFLIRRMNFEFSSSNKSRDGVLILMPADILTKGGKSFGDEMLLLGLTKLIKQNIPSATLTILQLYGRDKGPLNYCGELYQATKFRRNWLSPSAYFQVISKLKSNSHFIVIGADVLDGAYGESNSLQRLRFLDLSVWTSCKSIVTGFSYNGHGSEKIKKAFNTIYGRAKICSRDTISAKRLLEFLPAVENSADLAFLVDSENYPISKAVAGIREGAVRAKSAGKLILGINLCGWNIKDKDQFFREFCLHLSKLTAKIKIAIVLLPHDTRPNLELNDLETLQALQRQLGGSIEILGDPKDIQSGIDAKQATRSCDVVLTGRMHLAIAALSQLVPVVSFGYQGKFEGLYDLFGFGNEFAVSYDDLDHCFTTLEACIQKKETISVQIASRLQGVVTLAEKNLEI